MSFGQINFKDIGRATIALRDIALGEVVLREFPLVRSFPPEKIFVDICNKHDIEQVFGQFLIGFIFADDAKQQWILNEMYWPQIQNKKNIEKDMNELLEICKDVSNYTQLRYQSHPKHWDQYITRKPLEIDVQTFITLYFIWNTNSHTFGAYFTPSDINSDDLSVNPGYEEISREEGKEFGTAMFELASRVPHSCSPNMSYVVRKQIRDDRPLNLVYRCVRPTKIGEILSFSYIDSYDLIFRSTSMRRADLMRHKYFFCLCPRCRSEDLSRPLFCPQKHICKNCKGKKPFAFRCDVEGWEHVMNNKKTYGIEFDENELHEMKQEQEQQQDFILPQPSVSVFEDKETTYKPNSLKDYDQMITLPISFPVILNDSNKEKQTQSSSSSTNNLHNKLLWGQTVDTPFALSSQINKPWRCSYCNERFTEYEMIKRILIERMLKRIAFILIGKEDYGKNGVGIGDDDVDEVEDEIELEMKRQENKNQRINEQVEIEKDFEQESISDNDEQDEDEDEDQESHSDEDEQATASERMRRLEYLIGICEQLLGKGHWTVAWLHEQAMETVASNLTDSFVTKDDATSQLIKHGVPLIGYAERVTRNGLDYSTGPAYFTLRLGLILEQISQQMKQTEMKLRSEREKWKINDNENKRNENKINLKEFDPIPSEDQQDIYSSDLMNDVLHATEQVQISSEQKDQQESIIINNNNRICPCGCFARRLSPSSRLFRRSIVPFLAEWGIKEQISEHLMENIEGGRVEAEKLLQEAGVILEANTDEREE
ncbi:MAG: hypothetical protein EZS28_004629 [Streblomastix strix]|uniref:SET domain-containing protein n=1 Tax=Streblomastix strix TaxID=222440 RepID=A0A5J4WXN9_9EUKA|nr:MAG: hypothetical protein EZS28_004629 [Streblomastix strix]